MLKEALEETGVKLTVSDEDPLSRFTLPIRLSKECFDEAYRALHEVEVESSDGEFESSQTIGPDSTTTFTIRSGSNRERVHQGTRIAKALRQAGVEVEFDEPVQRPVESAS